MTDFLGFPEFIWPGICAGVLVGILCAYYGVFVVQRGLGFLAAGLAHAAYGGVALGLVLGFTQPMWVAVPYMLLLGLLLTFLRQRTGIRHDTLIGVAFTASMALGVILLDQSDLNADAMAYLFGDLIFVQWSDVWICVGLFVMTLLLLPYWGRWAYASFDEELAAADHIAIKRDEYVLITMIALLVAASVKIAGIILTSSLFIIPAASAALLTRQFAQMTCVAILAGGFTVLLGMYVSNAADWPCGAAIIMVQTIFFSLSAVFARK